MDKVIGIYKITSPSNRVYIGQSMDVLHRIYQYNRLFCKKQPKLYNSLKKYGSENHKFEVIEECIKENLNEREAFWKKQELNKVKENWDEVLFCELYDNGSGPRSEEIKQKMRKPKPKNFMNEKLKNKISKANKGRKILWKDKISKSLTGRTLSESHKKNKWKPIIQYDLNNNLIKEWESIKSASDELKINSGDISTCCRGRQITAKGFIWKYKLNT